MACGDFKSISACISSIEYFNVKGSPDVLDSLTIFKQLEDTIKQSSKPLSESDIDKCLLVLTIIQGILKSTEKSHDIQELQNSFCESECPSRLIEIYDNPCPLLQHAASKTLVALFIFKSENKPFCDNLLMNLVERFFKCDEKQTIHCLEVFKTLLTAQETKAVLKLSLLQSLSGRWDEFVKLLLTWNWDNPTQHTFLSLWVKLVKLKNTIKMSSPQLNEAGAPSLKSPPDLEKLSFHINQVIEHLDKFSSCSYVFSKVLSLLKHAIKDSGMSSQRLVLQSCVTILKNTPLEKEFTGFGGSCVQESKTDQSESEISAEFNYSYLRKSILVLMRALSHASYTIDIEENASEGVSMETWNSAWLALSAFITKLYLFDDDSHWVISLFGDQDEQLIEIMFCLLEVFCALEKKQSECLDSETVHSLANPHKIFIWFVYQVGFEHSVLLDFLMSSETCCLLYLTRYLKYMNSHWEHFVQVCQDLNFLVNEEEIHSIDESSEQCDLTKPDKRKDSDTCEEKISCPVTSTANSMQSALVLYSDSEGSDQEQDIQCNTNNQTIDSDKEIDVANNPCLDQVMATLIRLRMTIERLSQKNLFPYDASPLLNMMLNCEQMYES